LHKVHSICSYRETDEDSFPYLIGAFRDKSSLVEGYTIVDVPTNTWAIFPSEKFKWDDIDEVIGSLYKRVFTEWLPMSDYEQVGGLGLELYGGTDELGYIELWLAVTKK